MTYANSETGSGSPVELYTFRRGVDKTYYYTSHDTEIVFQSQTYLPIQIKHSGLEQNSEVERSELRVTLQRDAQVMENYIAFPNTQVMTLTVHRQHLNDLDTEFIVSWRGRVLTAEWKGSEAELSCEPVFTSLKRHGLRRHYQSQCPHILYGSQCKLNNQAYKVVGTVSGFLNNTITAPEWGAFPDGYFDGGYVVLNSTEQRAIRGHVGTQLTLTSALDGVSLLSLVEAFPGCNHSLSECDVKFSNADNYGGFPFVPNRNPFGGTLIF